MATTLEQVLRDIEELTLDEKRRVRHLLDQLLDPPFEPSPAQRKLLEAGLLRTPADPRKCQEFHRNHRPIKLGGKLVSEQILEERR